MVPNKPLNNEGLRARKLWQALLYGRG